MGMNAEKSNYLTRQWFGASALALALTVPAYAASVPVVDSQPVGSDTSTQAVVPGTDPEVEPVSQVVTTGGNDATGTAYLLNTIEQMRQEIMELRGQLEEHQFQINQLRQEGRDRYLDLDERISRQNNGSTSNTARPTVAPAPVATVTTTMGLATPTETSAADESAEKTLEAAEQNSYQAAFQLIRDKQFEDAQKALKQQLETYPKGKYADNARYWLGEVQMAQGKYPEARDAFQLVIKDYPGSPKVPDATYKLGRLYDLLGDKAKAKEMLQRVVKNYPDTAAARLSDTYLRSMPGS